ncbi:MAG: sigma-54 interaction domain-containing protein [Planctomycetota bacterium]
MCASALFAQVLEIANAVAANDCVVLLEGESGTGKELIARRIHTRSARRNGPFIPVNCAGISEGLFESQFYGHEEGAFTGASHSTLGVARAAQDGTLLLDEVGELPLTLQPKLLRLLQEREVMPVGSRTPVAVNARFIAATNCDLARLVSEGRFRHDLYHRLNVVRIEIPPLRSRPEDIEPLLEFYLDACAAQYHMPRRVIGPRLRRAIREYPWPGNVRELACYVERMYAANLPPMPPAELMAAGQSDGTCGPYAPAPPRPEPTQPRPAPARSGAIGEVCSLAEAEANAIRRALRATGFNRSAAARVLQIHRSTLLRKMRTYGLS